MRVGTVIRMLRTDRASIVRKKIGISERKLLEALKNAGYEYSRSIGWHYVAAGEPPLKKNIQGFVLDTKKRKKANEEDMSSSFTKGDMKVLHEIMSEWASVKKTIQKCKEGGGQLSTSEQSIELIYSLHMRTKEIESKEKVSRTVNLDKELYAKVGDLEEKSRLNRDEIIEFALREFFEKYKAQ
ncbi:hypothetical protein A9498_26905 [Bacillus thuringiensis serovar coreanensis]|nr:hypothetical protein A9498_26905 [Bacillus thuringiensis serovar coreanensis]